MRNTIKTFVIAIILVSICNCGNSTNTTTDETITFDLEAIQDTKKIIATPVFLKDSDLVAAAFLLPSDWKSNSSLVLQIDYTAQTLINIEMQNKEKTLDLKYDRTPTYLDVNVSFPMVEAMGNNNPYVQENPSLSFYFENYVLPEINSNWKLVSQENISNAIFNKEGDMQCEVFKLQSIQNPNLMKEVFLKKTTFYYGEQGNSWTIEKVVLDGNTNAQKEGNDVAKLFLSSFSLNPIYYQFVTQIIQNMTEANRRLYENTMQLNREANNYFFNTLHSIQAQSNATINSTSEQFSDMMLDVTTYKLPNGNGEIKLPSTLEYNYTNNLGDFVSTDNPLFDPKTGLESIHNWELLQKKYQ